MYGNRFSRPVPLVFLASCAVLVLAVFPVDASSQPATTAAEPDSNRVVTLVADAWPPFNSAMDEDPEGYMIDVAREVFEPLGYTVRYLNVPWKRALSGTMSGLYDGAVGSTRVEGAGLVFPEQELSHYQVSFYVRNDSNWRFADESSLAGVTVGAARGYDYTGMLNRYLEDNEHNPARVQMLAGDYPLRQNIRKLLSGRIDVLVSNEGSFRFVARELGVLDQLKLAGHASEVSKCYIAFSPATPTGWQYAEILSQGIESLRHSGRLAIILARYGLSDWSDAESDDSGGTRQ